MTEIGTIKYEGRAIPKECTDEEAADLLLDQIISETEIPVSEARVEQELNYELAGFLQKRRYLAMGGDHQLEEVDLEEWQREIRREIIRDQKVEWILNAVIDREKLTVSFQELEEMAIKLSEEEQTTLEMVQRFMGEDYALLKKDALYEKAKRWMAAKAKREEQKMEKTEEF